MVKEHRNISKCSHSKLAMFWWRSLVLYKRSSLISGRKSAEIAATVCVFKFFKYFDEFFVCLLKWIFFLLIFLYLNILYGSHKYGTSAASSRGLDRPNIRLCGINSEQCGIIAACGALYVFCANKVWLVAHLLTLSLQYVLMCVEICKIYGIVFLF